MTTSHSEATISADPDVPIVRIVRDFDAPAELLMRAHLDAELFCRWVGPDGMETETVAIICGRAGESCPVPATGPR
mgnify:CR=1 FL=1